MGRYFTIEDVASLGNLVLAAKAARRRKSRRPDVDEYHRREESNLLALRGALLDGTWQPGPYRKFVVWEPKRRLICAAPYPDRVAHHALCRLLEPPLSRRFLARSFSCQKGKGTSAARECVRQLVNAHRFVLKCDVRRFFESIDHEILMERLFEEVHCPGVRRMIALIVASHTTPGCGRPRGLPLGNLTSQLWANFFLDSLDHWVAEERGFGAFARYTDDFLTFADAKESLWELRRGIEERLSAQRLEFAEGKTRIMATAEGVPFCGFVFRPELRPRILGATKRRFETRRQRLARPGEDFGKLSVAVRSWYGFAGNGNTLGLRRAYATSP